MKRLHLSRIDHIMHNAKMEMKRRNGSETVADSGESSTAKKKLTFDQVGLYRLIICLCYDLSYLNTVFELVMIKIILFAIASRTIKF